MHALGNERIEIAVTPTDADDITAGELLQVLANHPASRLTFVYGGHAVRPGYHLTEVKAGQFAALDCGANPESWTELFIQLWDVDDSPDQMTAKKFASIIRKVTEHVALDLSARLTFEVSDGVAPMQLHRAGTPTVSEGEVTVELSPRPASCKPRDRWLAEQNRASCCGGQISGAKRC